jgi:hypothetical protein
MVLTGRNPDPGLENWPIIIPKCAPCAILTPGVQSRRGIEYESTMKAAAASEEWT